ncbi:hypothetical protein PF003_g16068 [Phytophthora fragariae]|nr:hypothetical protein PF003_g16068 [Phytophthora fragariae]
MAPPPLVDASGARRYVVERLVDHDTRANRESPASRLPWYCEYARHSTPGTREALSGALAWTLAGGGYVGAP